MLANVSINWNEDMIPFNKSKVKSKQAVTSKVGLMFSLYKARNQAYENYCYAIAILRNLRIMLEQVDMHNSHVEVLFRSLSEVKVLRIMLLNFGVKLEDWTALYDLFISLLSIISTYIGDMVKSQFWNGASALKRSRKLIPARTGSAAKNIKEFVFAEKNKFLDATLDPSTLVVLLNINT